MIGYPNDPQGAPVAPDLANDLAALERRVNILSATHEPVSPSRFVALEKSVRDMLPRLDTIEWDMRAQGAHVKGVEGDCNGLRHDIDALTQRVAALEAERTPQSGPRLCPDCFTVVPVGHQCRVPPTVRVSESGSAPSPAPPAAPDRCPGPLPTGSLCSHGKTVRLEWPGCLLCGPANCQHAKAAPHDIDPPAATALLPCPFCGEPGYNIGSSCDPCVGCLSCEFELSPDRWNRRPPADARLRELAACYLEHSRLEERCTCQEALTSYLHETAR